MRDVVSRIPAPPVTHPFDVEYEADLAGRFYWQRRELDACKVCLAGDEPHSSRMPEKAPPPLNEGVVIRHGVQTLLGSLAVVSNAPAYAAQATPLLSKCRR